MNILVLECSTSAAKAMAYHTNGKILGQITCKFGPKVSDLRTQDAEAVFATMLACGRQVVEQTNAAFDAIVLVSTWHSMLFCEEGLRPAGRIRLWSDLESAETVSALAKDGAFRESFYRKTGCILHPTYPALKYYHLSTHDKVEGTPAVYAQGEYLYHKLTGERAVSKSIASGSGLLNLHTLDWDDELLCFAGIRREALGPLCEEDHCAPLSADAAALLGLKQGTPVYVGVADGCATQLGCEATGLQEMTISVGTSGALRMAFSKPLFSKEQATWCYYMTGGRYIAGAATNGACNCVNRFADKYGKRLAELDMSLKQVDALHAPIFLPFLFGERSPGWRGEAYGGFRGKTGDMAQNYYAVLEGITFNLYQCYLALSAAGGMPKRVRITGGVNNCSDWLQMFADIFGCEMQASSMQHASLLGGAALVAKACGEYKEGSLWKTDRTVRPDPKKSAFYKERFEKYTEYYKAGGNRTEDRILKEEDDYA